MANNWGKIKSRKDQFRRRKGTKAKPMENEKKRIMTNYLRRITFKVTIRTTSMKQIKVMKKTRLLVGLSVITKRA